MSDGAKIIPFRKRGQMKPILTDAQRWALWAVDGEPDPRLEVPLSPFDADIVEGKWRGQI
jgi:hypothetical protein